MRTFIGIMLKFLSVLILISCVFLFIPIRSNAINHFILSSFEKKFADKLSFRASKIWLPGDIVLEGVSASGRGGVVYTAKSVDVKYNLIGVLSGKKKFNFAAKDVEANHGINLLASVSSMLAMSNIPKAQFATVEGALDFKKDSVHLKGITASTDKMRIVGDGWVAKDGNLDCTVHFSFSSVIVNSIPEVVRVTLLTEESDGWMGITLKTSGNYSKPSLHIDSDTFIMNIKEGSLKIR